MANNKVDAYLEALENKLRDELIKYIKMDHEDAIKANSDAIESVKKLRGEIAKAELISRSHLAI